MPATPLKDQDPEKARALAQPIYDIVQRLGQPPTAGELRQMEALARQGADLEIRYNGEFQRDTVLYIALCREYFDAAHLLIRNGADVNARCVQECTPFIFAALKGSLEVLEAMYNFGNAPDNPDRDSYVVGNENKTGLMVAAEHGRAACARYLIDKGADMYLKNGIGKSALIYAEEKGFTETIDAMKQAVAAKATEHALSDMLAGTSGPVTVMKGLRLLSRKAKPQS